MSFIVVQNDYHYEQVFGGYFSRACFVIYIFINIKNGHLFENDSNHPDGSSDAAEAMGGEMDGS